jgi:hypothetical protein
MLFFPGCLAILHFLQLLLYRPHRLQSEHLTVIL